MFEKFAGAIRQDYCGFETLITVRQVRSFSLCFSIKERERDKRVNYGLKKPRKEKRFSYDARASVKKPRRTNFGGKEDWSEDVE